MNSAFVISTSLVAVLLTATTNLGVTVLNHLPMIIAGYAVAAVGFILWDDIQRHSRQLVRTPMSRTVRPAVKPTDPAYAGATWGFCPAAVI
jgi:hypothetical protein